ncbi:zinc dependent phospholipase C family protein [Paenibacillus sp. J2TS4]|uniref:zinc dependent phospholipase C family protein n=1 Tax=Paenibacillus sp. J2TS4 TaxID=2807194 RepID=UPI001B205EB3|nr:zinc dependent phospholipase C family protein [Paenibacillus sp. J2TS4]GIP31225.1 hypothetical protein J2TS4_04350 [Paenibacillus sp. J2TS4]
MPSQLVHLAVAVKMNESGGAGPAPSFVLGSIAPDAIHKRPGTNREDKTRTHLYINQPGADASGIIRSFLQPYFASTEVAEDKRQLVLGYAAHLLTDYYWLQSLNAQYVEAVAPHMSKEEIRTLYYRETDKNEFRLYREASWRPAIWELLRSAKVQEVEPYLTAEEIDLWRERVLTWPEVNEETECVPEYFTADKIELFIDETSVKVERELSPYWQASKN